MEIGNIVAIALGLVNTFVGAGYLITRSRKRREEADTRREEADADGKDADALGKWQDSYVKLQKWAQSEIARLEHRIKDLERENRAVPLFAAHVEDLYRSIELEVPEAVRRILGRLTTVRPARGREKQRQGGH